MAHTVRDLLDGRDNNFNLIRFLAALAVIYDHSFKVTHGVSVSWLLPGVMTEHFGWYAVNMFFILSGFLVTKSWLARQDLISFCVARGLRLFPALSVCTLLVAFVLGPLVCLCLILHYFSDPDSWLYVPLTASLITPHHTLPHVFETLPVKSVVNSPLWTLRYEALSYLAVAALGAIGLFKSRERGLRTVLVFFIAYLVITTFTGWREQSAFLDSLMRFWLCFFLGASAYLIRDQLTLRGATASALLIAAALSYGTLLYEFTLQAALAYGILWVALIPSGKIRKFNNHGDYSYGLYIFAWPLQQTAVLIAPNLSPHELFVLVVPAILLVAAASWHWVERPALKSHHRVMDWMEANQRRLAEVLSAPK